MIKTEEWLHSGSVSAALVVPPVVPAAAARDARLRALHAECFDFAWRSLRRLGLTDDEADDATQQVFLVVARKLDEIALGRERSFVFGIVVRTASDVRRARARRPAILATEPADLADPSPGPEALLDQRRARALLDRVLEEMDWSLRTVFVLYELEEMTMAEIAETLELPAGTVASRLRRAREDFEARVARWEAAGRGDVERPRAAEGDRP